MFKRESSAKITQLESHTIAAVKKFNVLADVPMLNWRLRLQAFCLRLLLGTQNGVAYVFSFTELLLKERTNLEVLKQEGFIEAYGEGVVYCDYPRFNFFGVVAQIGQTEKKFRSWGYTLSYEDKAWAIKKAFWETLERYASYFTPENTINKYPIFKPSDVTFLYDYIPKHTKTQIANDSTLVSSTEDLRQVMSLAVASLTGDSSRFLPADCFFWGNRVCPTDKIFQENTTSGAGGGATKEQALLSGFYELIERDLFLLWWFSGARPPLIDIGEATGSFFDQVRDARQRFNLEVYFFQTTYDIAIPATVCLIIDPVLKLVALGGKVSAEAEDTLKGAYLEALATLSLVRSRNNSLPETVLRDIITKKTWGSLAIGKTERVNLYNSSLGIETLKRLWLNGNKTTIPLADFVLLSRSYQSDGAELNHLLEQQRKLVLSEGEGYHAYGHSFSSALTKRYDCHTARVFVPAFLKLHLDEAHVAPVSQRLFDFARLQGHPLSDENDLNHLPHPFP